MKEQNNSFDESLISAYLDGELSDGEQMEIESAIQNSPSLQQLVRDLTMVRSIVAAASPREQPTRSFQSSEWNVPSVSTDASVDGAKTNAMTPKSESASSSTSVTNRLRLPLGLLASLAAVVLIYFTTRSLIESPSEIGRQIAMDSMAPKAANTMLAPPISPQIAAASSAASSAEAASQLSADAKDLLAYLEQKLNSTPETQGANRWRFTTDVDLGLDSQAEQIMPLQENVFKESEKNILVEVGNSQDEIILKVTEDNAKAILLLADYQVERHGDIAKEQELIAFAIPVVSDVKASIDSKRDRIQTEGLSDSPEQKSWTIDFSPQVTSSIAMATDESGTQVKEQPSDSSIVSGMAGPGGGMAGGGYGGIASDASERSRSKLSGSEFFSPKANANRAANRAVKPSSPLPATPKLGPEQVPQNVQSLESTNSSTESGNSRGAIAEAKDKEKLMRIRIRIKKEPSSYGSNE